MNLNLSVETYGTENPPKRIFDSAGFLFSSQTHNGSSDNRVGIHHVICFYQCICIRMTNGRLLIFSHSLPLFILSSSMTPVYRSTLQRGIDNVFITDWICKPGSVEGNHLSGRYVAAPLPLARCHLGQVAGTIIKSCGKSGNCLPRRCCFG